MLKIDVNLPNGTRKQYLDLLVVSDAQTVFYVHNITQTITDGTGAQQISMIDFMEMKEGRFEFIDILGNWISAPRSFLVRSAYGCIAGPRNKEILVVCAKPFVISTKGVKDNPNILDTIQL